MDNCTKLDSTRLLNALQANEKVLQMGVSCQTHLSLLISHSGSPRDLKGDLYPLVNRIHNILELVLVRRWDIKVWHSDFGSG